jgi:hypothetical protein
LRRHRGPSHDRPLLDVVIESFELLDGVIAGDERGAFLIDHAVFTAG